MISLQKVPKNNTCRKYLLCLRQCKQFKKINNKVLLVPKIKDIWDKHQ